MKKLRVALIVTFASAVVLVLATWFLFIRQERGEPITWISAEVIENGTKVRVSYQSGSPKCTFTSVEVEKVSPSEAHVTVYQAERAGLDLVTGRACTGIAVNTTRIVELDAPLDTGARLVDPTKSEQHAS